MFEPYAKYHIAPALPYHGAVAWGERRWSDAAVPSVELWFEFASTYSYPAVERVGPLAAARGLTVTWRPFLLGPIFRAQGWNDSPFNIYPVKGRYMWRDLERLCAKHGLPFRRPSAFPRSGLLAARVACVASGEPWCADFVRRVYRANFADDRDIADAAVVSDVLGALGQPAAEVLARAGAPETKEALRRQTERAIELGIFGAPTCVVDGELFWGNDRLEDAIAWAVR
jgi:2-hydroxychromene-2-carboxylate isomerase